MKNLLVVVVVFFFISSNLTLIAQNVGINTTGNAPNVSAMLDISSTNKGLLIPRLDLDDATTTAPVTSPAEGLLIYNETGTEPHGFYYWDGTEWIQFSTGSSSSSGWDLTGNTLTGTLPASPTQWIGTINAADFMVKTSGIERMRVRDNGYIGIGTNAPIKTVHIIGDNGTTEDVVLENNGGTYAYLHHVIRNKTGAGSMSYSFSQQTGNSHFAGIDLDAYTEQLIIRNNYCTTNGFDNGVITFVTRNAGGSGERVRIDNDGNLGVGASTVRTKFHVAGGIGIGSNASNGLSTIHGAENTIQINTDIYYGGAFDEHSGYLMYSTMSGGWAQSELIFACSTDWGVYNTASPALKINQTACTMHGVAITSDRRLKTDIKDINYGLTALMKMKPVAYKKHTATEIIKGKVKLEDKGIDRVGFIAQDLYEIIPEVVFKPENSDKDFWSIDYSKISVIAVKAIQEQQKVIEQQQKDILKLTKQNDRILKLLEELMNDKETGR